MNMLRFCKKRTVVCVHMYCTCAFNYSFVCTWTKLYHNSKTFRLHFRKYMITSFPQNRCTQMLHAQLPFYLYAEYRTTIVEQIRNVNIILTATVAEWIKRVVVIRCSQAMLHIYVVHNTQSIREVCYRWPNAYARRILDYWLHMS